MVTRDDYADIVEGVMGHKKCEHPESFRIAETTMTTLSASQIGEILTAVQKIVKHPSPEAVEFALLYSSAWTMHMRKKDFSYAMEGMNTCYNESKMFRDSLIKKGVLSE